MRKQLAVAVTAKKFKKPFSGANGTNMLGAEHADIIRSLIEVG
ncbi:hypothetical protein [Bradyrhizobium nitroreducens]|nr:hypothetical protein [Bradyrhizobium nitroreducens]